MTEKKWIELPYQFRFKFLDPKFANQNVVQMDRRRSDMQNSNVTGITGQPIDTKAITTWLDGFDDATHAGLLAAFGAALGGVKYRDYAGEQLYRAVWTDIFAGLNYAVTAFPFNRTAA